MHYGHNLNNEVVVLNAGRSLLKQLSRSHNKRLGLSVRMLTSRRSDIMATAISGEVSTIIDATADPHIALEALQSAINLIGPGKIAVYTEVLHDGLELSVRKAGVLLLFGPLKHAEWRGFFEPRLVRQAPRPHRSSPTLSRRGGYKLPQSMAPKWRKQAQSTDKGDRPGN